MKKANKILLLTGISLLLVFCVYTALIATVGVEAIGPNGSEVGFASLNGAFHRLTGVNWDLYDLTDLLGLLPLLAVLAFAGLGAYQWWSRRSLRRVERTLFVLGAYYIVVLLAFVAFEVVEINYRPVLVEGVLEASYPSSTTMLALTVLPTLIVELRDLLPSRRAYLAFSAFSVVLAALMLFGRLLSGVHWLTDIIGGGLLSAGLVGLYCAACDRVHAK